MKHRLTAILLLVVLMISCTHAGAEDIDLSLMSYEELLSLRNKIMDEMLTRPEWENVLVPAGVYEIGVDIPEGTWTITAEEYSDPYVNIGNGINDTRTDFAGDCIEWAHLTGIYNSRYNSSSTVSVTWKFSIGHYFISDGPTIFTRAIRPSLGFADQGD